MLKTLIGQFKKGGGGALIWCVIFYRELNVENQHSQFYLNKKQFVVFTN